MNAFYSIAVDYKSWIVHGYELMTMNWYVIVNGYTNNKLVKKFLVPVNSQMTGIKSWVNKDYTIQKGQSSK